MFPEQHPFQRLNGIPFPGALLLHVFAHSAGAATVHVCLCIRVQLLSRVRLFVTPWIVALLSVGLSR